MTAAVTRTERTRSEHEVFRAGFIAGLIKLGFDTTLAPLILLDPWGVMRRQAAIVLGRHVVPLNAPFGLGTGIVALAVHFALSFFYAYLLILALRRTSRLAGIAIALIFGVAIYLFNFYVLTGIFPWFVDVRGVPQLVSTVVFTVTVSFVYYAMHPPPRLEEIGPSSQHSSRMVL
ncbi:Na+/proline symporter [Labilithrix luteola]|uniref:Na+/proline symporter n=1 Tax=Labilithrix luteola TaxID=1391654 RepID=A0A0K1QFH9_9BACT|nr:hypothetical protein [Labilithrix luteola]AKV04185.1 Na+/proline symporter [Labilithrix luteola]